VGDPVADHNCWERPEDMDTPRTVYKIDGQTTGTEIAAETAAALAASSIVFKGVDNRYSRRLLWRAQLVSTEALVNSFWQSSNGNRVFEVFARLYWSHICLNYPSCIVAFWVCRGQERHLQGRVSFLLLLLGL